MIGIPVAASVLAAIPVLLAVNNWSSSVVAFCTPNSNMMGLTHWQTNTVPLPGSVATDSEGVAVWLTARPVTNF